MLFYIHTKDKYTVGDLVSLSIDDKIITATVVEVEEGKIGLETHDIDIRIQAHTYLTDDQMRRMLEGFGYNFLDDNGKYLKSVMIETAALTEKYKWDEELERWYR